MTCPSTVPSNARGVTVTCPFPGGVSWDNPSIPITLENIDSGIFLELEEYQIYCVCLHEAHAMMVSTIAEGIGLQIGYGVARSLHQ